MSPDSNTRLIDYVWRTWWQRCLVVFFVVIFLVVVFGEIYTLAYFDKIYPGVKLGSYSLSGLTFPAAENKIQTIINKVNEKDLVFVWDNQSFTVPAMVDYNLPKTIFEIKSYGRQGTFLNMWFERWLGLIGQAQITPSFTWNQEELLSILKSNLADLETPGRNAGFFIQGQEVDLAPERAGVVFDYNSVLLEAEKQVSNLVFNPIPLQLKRENPTVLISDVEPFLPDVKMFLIGNDIKINFASSTWPIKRQDLALAFEVRLNSESDEADLGLNEDKLKDILASIEKAVNIPNQEPKFKMENNKVVEFKAGVAGREIDLKKTRELWEQQLILNQQTELGLVVTEKELTQQNADINNFGIKELLGIGKSNFAGSPKNRRHNIKVGAEAVNGSLLAPGEEFSLLKTLGKVDASSGYLPELVIKGNKTTPEYGGGLCQIGTTVFRGTLAAGLPVTERRNHSYQVSYYANDKGLPGTDATIYDPAPDYRFKNDTSNYVLITSRIEGDNVFFEFWGTKDGRQAEQSDVRVWDRVSSGPTKLIETLDLKPGEKKCTEKAHAGIKAAFDYKITYPDGKVSATTFSSQYRPWPEVCLIGVAELSATASTTTPILAPQDASIGAVN